MSPSTKLQRLLTATLSLATLLPTLAADWPNWRGPNQDGSTTAKNLPSKFSKSEAVKWAVPVPGMSASCPVIVGDKVFLTAPVASEQKLVGLCYDANSGKELWRKAISDGLRWDDRSNMANPSPTADSERVVFLFSNAQLAAYSHTGDELWKRDLTETHGAFGTQWTYGSSPLLDNGKLPENLDALTPNYLAAIPTLHFRLIHKPPSALLGLWTLSERTKLAIRRARAHFGGMAI
jgi:hypothetical protein